MKRTSTTCVRTSETRALRLRALVSKFSDKFQQTRTVCLGNSQSALDICVEPAIVVRFAVAALIVHRARLPMTDKRRSRRKTISRHGKIQVADGSLPRDCLVTDFSEGGVRLHVEGFDVPDRFVLLLSDGDGNARPRDCSVVWRLGLELGAKFTVAVGRDDKTSGAAPAVDPTAV
jgi:PilZ domain-containing protein